jgi:hypothetical protein
LELVCCVTGQDGFPVRLTAIDDDPLGPAMPLERLAQEPLGRSQIAPLTEPELDRVAVAVDGPIKKHPASSDLDVCLINVPLAGDGSLE